MKKISTILHDFNELVMFKHSIFSLPFIFIAMIVAADGWFGWRLLGLGVLAAVTARNFAMGFNRWADVDIDRANPRTAGRPSVDGRLKRETVLLFTIANGIAFVVVAWFINALAFWLSFPILFILAGYSLMKRVSALAHLVLGLSLGLAPIAGVVAVRGEITMWSVMLSVGVVFWVAGFDLLYSLQDMEYDKAVDLHSIPSRYGAQCTLFLSKIFHALTILFWLFFAAEADVGWLTYVAVVLSAVILWMEHRIVEQDFKQIDKAFFTLNGYLGIMFLVFVILDYMI